MKTIVSFHTKDENNISSELLSIPFSIFCTRACLKKAFCKMCVTISPNKKQTAFYDLCFIKCGLSVSHVLFIEPGNNIRHPIWCVHISVHLDWFQSSHGDGGYVHPQYVHHPDTHIPTQCSAGSHDCKPYSD